MSSVTSQPYNDQVIVIGGGLSGLSAAHTILQAGGKVCIIDRNPFMGGNSTKATSGINGSETRTQRALGIPDSNKIFYEDTVRSATGIKKGPLPDSAWYELGKVLTHESSDAVHWIQDSFGLALDVTSRLGGHSHERTHRSKEGGKFPGMEITYRLMEEFERICKEQPHRAKLLVRARVQKLERDGASGRVCGVHYEHKGEKKYESGSAVVIATGGYGAGGLDGNSLLRKVRPDLYDLMLPTTNGSHCVGDGILFAQEIGAATVDLDAVQVHPTGLVNPSAPNERTLFLAAEALRGEGGILLDRHGKRFCNDLGTRDYVSACMMKHAQGPYRLVLNSECSSQIAWHCAHYCGRGVMKEYSSGEELAKDMGIPAKVLAESFDEYNRHYKNNDDPWDKPAAYYRGVPWKVNDTFNVAIVTPVVHYTMGGLQIDAKASVLDTAGAPIPGLYAAGEVTGGVHGNNRLGGSALLECVVFGRKSGKSVVSYVKENGLSASASSELVSISIPQPDGGSITITVSKSGAVSTPAVVSSAPVPTPAPTTSAETKPAAADKSFTLAEVAKHNTEKDCWVVVNGQVLDVTSFMHDHPGGKMAIMTFAGRDATHEFNMLHDKNVVEKYAPECIVGTFKQTSKM